MIEAFITARGRDASNCIMKMWPHLLDDIHLLEGNQTFTVFFVIRRVNHY